MRTFGLLLRLQLRAAPHSIRSVIEHCAAGYHSRLCDLTLVRINRECALKGYGALSLFSAKSRTINSPRRSAHSRAPVHNMDRVQGTDTHTRTAVDSRAGSTHNRSAGGDWLDALYSADHLLSCLCPHARFPPWRQHQAGQTLARRKLAGLSER